MKRPRSAAAGKNTGQDKYLSIDEYIDFVNFNRKYFPQIKAAKRDEIAMRVNIPFSIRE